jgi:hypothetical protein
MTLLAGFGKRLQGEEAMQLLAVLFLLFGVVFIFSWPTASAPENSSWNTVGTVRRVALGVCALFLGVGSARGAARDRLLGVLVLVAFTLLTAPFEVAALAASYAAAPLALVLLLGTVTPVALYGLALLLALACRRIGLGWLVLLLLPLSLAALVYADLTLDVQLFSPVVTVSASAWPHALLAGAAALLTLLLLIGKDRRAAGSSA